MRGNAVGGHATVAKPFVPTSHGFGGDAGAFRDLDAGGAGGRCGPVVQTAEPPERCEPPDLVATAGHLERVDVERGEDLALIGGSQS